MAYPKITYTDSAGAAQTLLFQWPPTKKPYAWVTPDRTDSVSIGGVKQSIWLRNDTFFECNMEFVEADDDAAAWAQFMSYALTGGPFTYCPDADVDAVSTDYTLEDTDWKPGRATIRQMFTFKMKWRQVVLG